MSPGTDAPPLLEYAGVGLTLGGRPILHGLNLRVARGERLVILGQSGAGKSTLLRMALGLLAPEEGAILYDGEPLGALSPVRLDAVRRHIGMVYQNAALLSSLTIRDNLALPLEELTRLPRGEIDAIVEAKLALTGMEECGPLYPAELSGGMRKRVAIARALVLEPELILFDEPTAGLDPILSGVIDELILTLSHRARATCIVVTHELESAFRIATRMAMLYQGHIIEEDLPERFRQKKHPFVTRFLEGRGPMC